MKVCIQTAPVGLHQYSVTPPSERSDVRLVLFNPTAPRPKSDRLGVDVFLTIT